MQGSILVFQVVITEGFIPCIPDVITEGLDQSLHYGRVTCIAGGDDGRLSGPFLVLQLAITEEFILGITNIADGDYGRVHSLYCR